MQPQDFGPSLDVGAIVERLQTPEVRRALTMRSVLKEGARAGFRSNCFTEFDTPTVGPRIDEYDAGHISTNMTDGSLQWLAQSPQIYKQMLIKAGYGRYFQFTHCFRDEPDAAVRADCLIEFVQMDLEMEADTSGQVMATFESILAPMFSAAGLEVPKEIPHLSATESWARFGTDRPDLRSRPDDMSFVWVVDFPLFEDRDGRRVLTRHPMAKTFRRDGQVLTHSYDLVLNGYEIASGDLRINDASEQREVLAMAGHNLAAFAGLLALLETDCPPHGGMGLGLDRLVMQLCGQPAVQPAFGFGLP